MPPTYTERVARLIAFAAVLALLVAGCGDETTIINNRNTTTVAPPPTTADAGEAPAPAQGAPPAEGPSPAEGEEESDSPIADPTKDDYKGPCGDPKVVVRGKPGASATTAEPGYLALNTVRASCRDGALVANAWLDAWEPSCVAGCIKRVAGMSCEYSGSGSAVVCVAGDTEVRFNLHFEVR